MAKQKVAEEEKMPLVGDWVFWYAAGITSNAPSPAIATTDATDSGIVSIAAFTPTGIVNIRNCFMYGKGKPSKIVVGRDGLWSRERIDRA